MQELIIGQVFGICATDKCAPFDKDSFTVRIPIMEEFIICYWFCGVDLNKPLINHVSPQIIVLIAVN